MAELVWSGIANLVSDGQPKNVTATVANAVTGDTVTVTVSGGNESNVGTYTATATALDNTDYALPTEASITYVISEDPAVTSLRGTILALSQTVGLESKTQVTAIRTAYNAMTPAQQAQLGAEAVQKLLVAESQVAAEEAQVANLLNLINALPDTVGLTYKDQVAQIRAAYDSLSLAQKAALGATAIQKLGAAETQIAEAEAAAQEPEQPTKLPTGNFSDATGRYTVNADSTAIYKGPAKDAATVTIPATIDVQGFTVKVTAIADKAFFKNKKLTTITIKSKKLTTVKSKAFKNVSANVVINVPNSKVTKYKKLFSGKGLKSTATIK